MSDDKTQKRVNMEIRALVIGIAFVLGLFILTSLVDQWRFASQQKASFDDVTALSKANAPRPAILPSTATRIDMVWDEDSGAAMYRFSLPPATATQLEGDVERGRHACPDLSQYWRHDHPWWCTDRDDLRRHCVDGHCMYLDFETRAGFIRVKGD